MSETVGSRLCINHLARCLSMYSWLSLSCSSSMEFLVSRVALSSSSWRSDVSENCLSCRLTDVQLDRLAKVGVTGALNICDKNDHKHSCNTKPRLKS